MRTIFMVLDLPQLISFSSCVLCQLPPSQKLPSPHLLSTLQPSARDYQTTFVFLAPVPALIPVFVRVAVIAYSFQSTLWHIYTITFDAQLLHSHLQQLAPCSRVTEASKPPSWNSV
ncbi:unnamed protein product [Fusarium graminearum]|nr:unnamed protein product [Fusarium graminearum]